MQDTDTMIRHDDPRDQAGKQWILIHDYYGRRRIQAFGKITDAKVAAWEIVAEIAKHAEIDIEDDRAAGDLWGAWDAVCGGEGSLTIEQIDLPAD